MNRMDRMDWLGAMVWVPMQMQMQAQMQAQTQIRIREIEFTSGYSRRAMKEREVVGPKPDD